MNKKLFTLLLISVFGNAAATVCTNTNSFDELQNCIQTNESKQLKLYPGRVERNDKALTFFGTNKKTLAVLKDRDGDNGSTKSFKLVDFLPPLNSWLVAELRYEGYYFLLIDSNSGRTTEFNAMPIVSPDGQKFVVVFGGSGETGEPAQLSIHRITSKGFEVEYSTAPETPTWYLTPNSAQWERPDLVRIEYSGDLSGPTAKKTTCEVRKSGNQWQLAANCPGRAATKGAL